MGTRLKYSGLVIAGIGFFLTRFTVALAIYEEPVRFYLAGVLPMVLGLGLAAFGVALAVADVEPALVRTTARWCVAGAGAMLVLVFLTLLGSTGGVPEFATVRSRAYLSNFLIGGSIGGTLTGLYAARNRRHRGTLHQQANRLEVLNWLLRHEVLNALTAIRGYAEIRDGSESEAREVIEERADAIAGTIEDVKYLTRSAGTGETSNGAVDLGEHLEESVETVSSRYPDADVVVDHHPGDLTVFANERLDQVFTHLLENAVVHTTGEGPTVTVTVTTAENSVHVSVSDDGPGLPERQQALLETGEIGESDDPGTGFGLNVVRLLVESYHGSIETEVDDHGTTVTVSLPRADAADRTARPVPSDLAGVRPAVPHMVVTLVAALVAGGFYGLVVEWIGTSVGIIGVLYGVENTVVGWIAHQFHSVVFAFVFASLVSLAPERYRNHVPSYVAIGTGWALFLCFVAAGVVSPIWLRLVGIPAPIPSLSVVTLVSHLSWGVSLGVLTALGFEHVTPWLARLGE